MFVGEYHEELHNGRVHFPFDVNVVNGWHCYLIEYDDSEHRFITVAEKDEDCEDGEVKVVGKLPLEFDGDCMLLSDEMIAHLSIDDGTVVFCGINEYIDIMSKSEYDKSLAFMSKFDNEELEKLLFGGTPWKE